MMADKCFCSIQDEVSAINEIALLWTPVTVMPHFIYVILAKSDFRRLVVKIHLPDTYPVSASYSLELISNTIDPSLLKKLLGMTEKHVKRRNVTTYGQAFLAFRFLSDFIKNNYLVPCWSEIKLIRENMKDICILKIVEQKGIVKLKIESGAFSVTVRFEIPEEYPKHVVLFKIVSSNLTKRIQHMLFSELNAFLVEVEKIIYGQVVLKQSLGDETREVSKSQMLQLKYDARYLQKIKDLREQSGDKEKRRMLARLVKKEAEDEKNFLESMHTTDEEINPVFTAENVQKIWSLWPSIELVKDQFLKTITEHKCQGCMKVVFPKSPVQLRDMSDSDEKYPERAHCGDWFHLGCLKTTLTTPPFAVNCSVCSRRITHPKFDSDVKKLEKSWAIAEARKRELAESVEFLGLEDFT